MEKKQDNTELIAFRMSKKLKAKLDAHCQEEGISIAAYFRCVVSNLPSPSATPPPAPPTDEGLGRE